MKDVLKFESRGLRFEIENDRVYLTDFLGFSVCKDANKKDLFKLCEVQLAGRNHAAHCGAKLVCCSETESLRYISYSETLDGLSIIQANDKISVATNFRFYHDSKTIKVYNVIDNISDEPVVLEHASSLYFFGLGEKGVADEEDVYINKFTNSWHIECQPLRYSLKDLGLFNGNKKQCMKRVYGCNTGSWSTKEELPQAIIEDTVKGKMLFFQIESNNSWYYEIGEWDGYLYLNAGGPNVNNNQWSVKIDAGKSYSTVPVAFTVGRNYNEVVAEMTRYRREISAPATIYRGLPVIYNEYMHYAWDDPSEENTIRTCKTVADIGADYYVIDCGWHDECPTEEIYKNVGEWMPSSRRFPSGLINTLEEIKKCGLKPGLWIEPEIVGVDNKKMREYYGDDCFFKRNGKVIEMSNRVFLDFRKKKVRDYLTATLKRMIDEYGAAYVKFDYNQDCGPGTETDAITLGDGLEQAANAFYEWQKNLMEEYPTVIFEACASGGQRMDFKTLSQFTVTSSSDHTDYRDYPYVLGNLFAAVLPEQSGVWSYPVDSTMVNIHAPDAKEQVEKNISTEQVIMNMVNAVLGRIHLSSAIALLSKEKIALVKEGVEYYKKLSVNKRFMLPYFPQGFAKYGDKSVACGLSYKNTIYLAVWNTGGDGNVTVPINEYGIASVKQAYPKAYPVGFAFDKHSLNVKLPEKYSGRLFEITVEK